MKLFSAIMYYSSGLSYDGNTYEIIKIDGSFYNQLKDHMTTLVS
jgi:hypothetical protein